MSISTVIFSLSFCNTTFTLVVGGTVFTEISVNAANMFLASYRMHAKFLYQR